MKLKAFLRGIKDGVRQTPDGNGTYRTSTITQLPEYRYDPLDETNFEVRLLILLPGEFKDPIRGLLVTTVLTEGDAPIYEALSYVWGSTEDLTPVEMRSASIEDAVAVVEDPWGGNATREPFGNVFITQNLRRAMPYLRMSGRCRFLWIDGICINQKDVVERSNQVKRMQDVYTLADRVIMWLGPESNNSKFAFNTLKGITKNHEFDYFNQRIIDCEGSTVPRWLLAPIELDPQNWNSLADIFDNVWFYRVWVWQEIQLANANSVLMSGSNSMAWSDFRNAVGVLHGRLSYLPETKVHHLQYRDSVDTLSAMESHVFSVCNNLRGRSFDQLIDITNICQCTDQRDRVYGLLALFDKNQISVDVDYTRSVHEVYQDAMVSYFRNTQALDALRLCVLTETESNSPSWVPDMATSKRPPLFLPSTAPWTAAVESDIKIEENQLKVTGLIVGTIKETYRSNINSQAATNLYEAIARDIITALVALGVNDSFIAEEQNAEPLAEAIVGYLVADLYLPPQDIYLSRQAVRDFGKDFNNFISSDYKSPSTNLMRILETVAGQSQNRAYFITTTSQFGMAPTSVRAGDVVVSVVGCQHLLVLRPTLHDRYQVIGECFCQGFAFGEPFRGELPEDVECLFGFPEAFRFFRSTKTDEVTVEDPRLYNVPLPDDYVKMDHEDQDTFELWRNISTEEIQLRDPRMTANEMRKRGIGMQDFVLI